MTTHEQLRTLAREIDELLYQSDPADYAAGNGLETISREQNIERIYLSILHGQKEEHENILMEIAEDVPTLRDTALDLVNDLKQINMQKVQTKELEREDMPKEILDLEQIIRERYDPDSEDTVSLQDMKQILSDLMKKDYQNFCKALFAIEFYLDDECLLDEMYSEYISNDNLVLLHSGFDQLLQNYYAKVEERFGKIIEEIPDLLEQTSRFKVLDLTTGETFIAQADQQSSYKINQTYIFVGEEKRGEQENLYQIISAVETNLQQAIEKSKEEREL